MSFDAQNLFGATSSRAHLTSVTRHWAKMAVARDTRNPPSTLSIDSEARLRELTDHSKMVIELSRCADVYRTCVMLAVRIERRHKDERGVSDAVVS